MLIALVLAYAAGIVYLLQLMPTFYIHEWKDYALSTVATCSVLHTVLPPWDWQPSFVTEGLKEFPSAQKSFSFVFNNRWYRLLIYVIGFIALNARSTVWRSLSIKTRVAAAVEQTKADCLEEFTKPPTV